MSEDKSDNAAKLPGLSRLMAFVPGPVIVWINTWQSLWGNPISSFESPVVEKWAAALGTAATLTIFAASRNDTHAQIRPKLWRVFWGLAISLVVFLVLFYLFRYSANAQINARNPSMWISENYQFEILKAACVIAYLALVTSFVALITFVFMAMSPGAPTKD